MVCTNLSRSGRGSAPCDSQQEKPGKAPRWPREELVLLSSLSSHTQLGAAGSGSGSRERGNGDGEGDGDGNGGQECLWLARGLSMAQRKLGR